PEELTNALTEGGKEMYKVAKDYGEILGLPMEKLAEVSKSVRIEINEDAKSNEEAIAGALLQYMNSLFGGWAAEIENLKKDGESATDTIIRVSQTLVAVNSIFKDLGWQAMDSTIASGKASVAFAESFGGFEQMISALQAYQNDFYSQE